MNLSPNPAAQSLVSGCDAKNINANGRRSVRLFLAVATAAVMSLALVGANPAAAQAQPAAEGGLFVMAPNATFVVNSLGDLPDVAPGNGICETDVSGQCTLRAAIMEANALPGEDAIDASGMMGTITLVDGPLPTISENLTITGPALIEGYPTLLINAGGASRHIRINSGVIVTISRVLLQNGQATESSGGAINNSGTLTLISVMITNSHADGDGGAIYGAGGSYTAIRAGSRIGLPGLANSANYGGGVAISGSTSDLIVDDSEISWNSASADGGGVYNWSGEVAVSNGSVIKNNVALARGGGLYNNGSGLMYILASTVAYNRAVMGGGGVYNYYSTLVATNSTFSSNSTDGSGGGIAEESIDTLFTYNVTITDNTADADADGTGDGGGLFLNGFANMANSILAGNEDLTPSTLSSVHPDCSAFVFSFFTINTHNLVGDNAGCATHFVNGASGNQVGSPVSPLDPVLGSLTSTFGGTPLHPVLAGSPAIDRGEPDGCQDHIGPFHQGNAGPPILTVDQRGMARPQNGRCDVGAYEAAWPQIENQFFSVPEFSPNGTEVGVVVVSDPNGGFEVLPVITGGNGTGDGAFYFAKSGYELVVGDSNQLDPEITPTFELTVVVTNSIGLTDTAIVAVDVLPDPLIVRNTNDSGPSSLRDAIVYANEVPGTQTISFDIPGPGPHVIMPQSPLPVIDKSVIIDGETQPNGAVILDGSDPYSGFNGLDLYTFNITVRGLVIRNFAGSGIYWTYPLEAPAPLGGATNLIENNVITGNVGNGIEIDTMGYVQIRSNSIYDNGLLGIDLGGDGVTPNDIGDADTGANDLQNFPVLLRAMPGGAEAVVEGRLNSIPLLDYNIEFYVSDVCNPSGFGEGRTPIGTTNVATDDAGNARFSVTLPVALDDGEFITALATDESGNTSEFSQCIVTGPGNDSWPRAFRMTLEGGSEAQTATINQYVDKLGQSRWYKFEVEPDSQVTVELANLPANYDVVVYKDIAAVYASLVDPQDETDLNELGAEFAPDMFSPDMFSPDMFSPDMFSPDMFSPDMFSPDMFSPDMFSPDMFSPDMFSPDMFSPDMFSPDMFSPDNFDPNALVEEAQAYASAQLRSIVAFSALNGDAAERAVVNTWTNTGDFYVRVRGRNGAWSLNAPFQLDVTIQRGLCQNLDTALVPPSLAAVANGYKTIILVDEDRLTAAHGDISTLMQTLQSLAGRPEVQGVVVDVSQDARVAAANLQADDGVLVNCPEAKNLVADATRQIVQRYRAVNPLEYVVIVGNDDIIPFFRTPDRALLAPESNYVPPVFNGTASQASLKLDYVLSQDAYGSDIDVSFKSHFIPVPDLAVGRLVETPDDMLTMLDAYLATPNGVLEPGSAFVSGYDFLAESAEAVQSELEAGIGQPASTLIAPRDQAPQDPNAWTGQQLIDAFLGQRHDLSFLAGHFSASSALAADYTTRMTTDDLLASPIDMTNAVVFSAGCHSGYNIVTVHGVPLVTREPDWAQAFASRGVTFIGGTGYQYGHTDFIAYSEQLYLNFAQHLRYGAGPVSIGQALVGAKQTYLANTPILRGIDEKSLLEATLFGLPMLSVNLPSGRIDPPSDPPVVGTPTDYGANPGLTLGLAFADISVEPDLTPVTRELSNTNNLSQTIVATYLEGGDALMLNPTEPVLPVEKLNVSVPGTVLRGLGFRGGQYEDLFGIIPLTSAAATEVRGIQYAFPSQAFYPTRAWNANYFDVLAKGPTNGVTRLMVIPAQFRGDAIDEIDGTLRTFSDMDFRLFYSDNLTSYPQVGARTASPQKDWQSSNVPSMAAPPAIVQVTSITSTTTISFNVTVTSDPSAGVQEVWATYTGAAGPFYGSWQSLDLTQDALQSTQWTGVLTLPDGQNWQDVRFIVQAVSGVGLVSMVTNFGDYFIPGIDPGLASDSAEPTSLALLSPPASGPYGTPASFSAQLTTAAAQEGDPAGIAGQVVEFGLGSQRRAAITGDDGIATVQFPLIGLVQQDLLRVTFAGSARYQGSSTQAPFTIVKQSTTLEVTPVPAAGQYSDNSDLQATLIAGDNRPMAQRSLFFVAGAPADSLSATASVITDYAGRAPAGPVNLPAGLYPVTAYFLGVIPVGGGQTVTLEDSRFLASTGVGTLAQTAENAAVAYTGETEFLSSKPIDLTALVTQEEDGMPGDLTLAQVRFVLRDGANQVVADVTGSADAAGAALASAPAQAAGAYTLTVQVVGGFFASPESAPIAIQVTPPTAVTLADMTAQASGQPAALSLIALLAVVALAGALAIIRLRSSRI